jgi:putative ABC transport system permease protein
LEEFLRLRSWDLRVFAAIFAIFAAIAFLLASVGLYAVIAHSVSQRTQEIGVRLAMGAPASRVLRMVFAQGMRQLAIGLAIGLPGAAAVSSVLRSIADNVPVHDPVTFTAVTLSLVGAGILGCAIPARRAVRVDPAVTLRHD